MKCVRQTRIQKTIPFGDIPTGELFCIVVNTGNLYQKTDGSPACNAVNLETGELVSIKMSTLVKPAIGVLTYDIVEE